MAKKKAAAGSKAVSLSDIYNVVASRADTAKTQINVAEVKRVLACFFDVLEDHSAAEAHDIIAKGLKAAGKRRR